MAHAFQLIDVFGVEDFSGNPLAVVHDAGGLDAATMERITRWLNLSETTFLLPPTTAEADYRVRIFAPEGEMSFAGHPTLGSCWHRPRRYLRSSRSAGTPHRSISVRSGRTLPVALPPSRCVPSSAITSAASRKTR